MAWHFDTVFLVVSEPRPQDLLGWYVFFWQTKDPISIQAHMWSQNLYPIVVAHVTWRTTSNRTPFHYDNQTRISCRYVLHFPHLCHTCSSFWYSGSFHFKTFTSSRGSLKSKCCSTSCTVPPVFLEWMRRKGFEKGSLRVFHSSECVEGWMRIERTDAGQSWHFSVWPAVWFRVTLTAMFLWWGLSVQFSSSQLFLTIDPVLGAHRWSSTCFQSHSCLRSELARSLSLRHEPQSLTE